MTPQLQKVLALAHLAAHNIPKKTFLRSAFMWKSHYVFTIKTTSVQVLLLKKLGENDQCKSAFPPSLKVLQMPNCFALSQQKHCPCDHFIQHLPQRYEA